MAIDKKVLGILCETSKSPDFSCLCQMLDTNIELQYFIHCSCRNGNFLVNYIQFNCGDYNLQSNQYLVGLNVHMCESKNPSTQNKNIQVKEVNTQYFSVIVCNQRWSAPYILRCCVLPESFLVEHGICYRSLLVSIAINLVPNTRGNWISIPYDSVVY